MQQKRAKSNFARIQEVTRRIQADVTLSLGHGHADWDANGLPDITGEEADLTSKFAHVRPFHKGFITPDPNGDIKLGANGRWSLTEQPTRHGIYRFRLDFNDGANLTIREIGIVEGATFQGVGDGQIYIPLANVLGHGEWVDMFRHEASTKLHEEKTFDFTFHP